MKIKIKLVRSSDQGFERKPVPEPVLTQSAPKAQLISTKFASFLREPALEALRNQKPLRIAPPIERMEPLASGSPLSRAIFRWLKGHRPSPKRLRVLETVTLGEKRMVAVIQAEGRRFLVGGGASGVSLLTNLDDTQSRQESFDSSGRLTELAG